MWGWELGHFLTVVWQADWYLSPSLCVNATPNILPAKSSPRWAAILIIVWITKHLHASCSSRHLMKHITRRDLRFPAVGKEYVNDGPSVYLPFMPNCLQLPAHALPLSRVLCWWSSWVFLPNHNISYSRLLPDSIRDNISFWELISTLLNWFPQIHSYATRKGPMIDEC